MDWYPKALVGSLTAPMRTISIISSCLLGTGAALAQSPSPQETILPEQLAKFCKPLVDAGKDAAGHGGAAFKSLSRDQWQFLRGLSVINPGTPPGIPPGDGAAISELPDGTAMIVFVDGDEACFPMPLPKVAVDYLMGIGRGDTTRLHQAL